MDLDVAADPRRLRRRTAPLAVKLAACVLVVMVLAGCSAMSGASDSGGGDSGGGAPVGESVDEGDEQAGEERAVVVEGWMSMTVDDVAAASADAQEIAGRAGGRVENRDESREEGEEWSTLALRIPADRLEQVVGELRDLGEVDHVTTTSTDVTDAVRDIDARLAALESTLARLSSFQSEADSVDDLLAIEREVSNRQAELEQLRAEQASYTDRVDYSSLTLELRSERAAAPLPDSFWGGLVVGWNALVGFVGGVVVVLGALLPWLVVFGGLALLIIWLTRRLRRRSAARAAARAADQASILAPRPDGVE